MRLILGLRKKTIKAKSPSDIFRAASISDVFDQVYTGEIKKRGIQDERNIRKSFTSKQNQPIMRKARDPTKMQVKIKSSFGKSPIISKTSINTQQESKEIFSSTLSHFKICRNSIIKIENIIKSNI